MKIFLSILLSLFSFYGYSSELSESKDYVQIFKSGKSFLKSPIYVYDAPDMKNKPIFVIDNKYVQVDKKKIDFDQILKCKDNGARACSSLNIPDFINYETGIISLAIDKFDSSIHIVSNKDRKYFLSMTKDNFENSKWPDGSVWKIYSNKKAQEKFLELINKDLSLKSFFENIAKCINSESILCLSRYVEKNERIEKMFKYREIAENPKLCLRFLKYDGLNSWEDMDEIIKTDQIQNSKIAWQSMRDLFKFDMTKLSVVLRTEMFQEADSVDLRNTVVRKLACENTTDFELQIKKIKNSNDIKEWKIIDLITYTRDTI